MYPEALRLPFYEQHARRLQISYQRLLGSPLLGPELADINALFDAPFALLSHGVEEDPVFNFGNRKALEIFNYSWENFIRLPSRFSAEPLDRQQRQRLLDSVATKGYIDNYSGVRIAADGTRFMITQAVVWNVVDDSGRYVGQAAKIGGVKSLSV